MAKTYVVHMKRVTASDARKNWFRLLDEVAAGEVVCIERRGTRILLQRDVDAERDAAVPDYQSLVTAPGVDKADEWGWVWQGPGDDLQLATDGRADPSDRLGDGSTE